MKISFIFLNAAIFKSFKKTWEYKVLTLNDINHHRVNYLLKIKAAKAIKGTKNKFKVLNKEKAKPQNSMPIILNERGKEGWSLVAVNKAKLYIFARSNNIFQQLLNN
ncbi:MAG: hypothetical protein KAH22_11745 [Thiotrichaceae bacterium]|nr:hypothetical protein [Thiotrichaceae bacterium]